MKKNLVKVVSLMLIAMMVLTLGACGAKDTVSDNEAAKTDTTENTNDTAKTDDSKEPPAAVGKLPIVEKKETLKILSYYHAAAAAFPDSNEVPLFKELEKRTNVHLEWELLPAGYSEAMEKFNLVMASGQLADIVAWGDPTGVLKYASQGAFIPLEDKIEKYAPNIQKVFDNPPFPYPNLKSDITAGDGHIYVVPFLTPITTGEVFAIREDWIKNVNMKMPETTEELYQVLKAFKEKDANGNGDPNDEFPFVPDTKENDLTILMNAFGAHGGWYIDEKTDTIKYGPLHDKERFIEGVEYVAKLYSEGLIDSEYLSITKAQFNEKNATNINGMMLGWSISRLGNANTALKQLDPDYKFVTMLPVKGPHGDRFKEQGSSKSAYRIMLTKDNKKVETTMKWLDYIYSEEGQLLMNYGIEGETFTMVNGKPMFSDYVLKNPDGKSPGQVRGEFGMQQVLPVIASLECEVQAQGGDPEIARSWEVYVESGLVISPFPTLPLNEEETAVKARVESELAAFRAEWLNKFFMGDEPVSKYDEFMDGLKSIGVEELLDIYNKAYKAYLEFAK